jgi:hypothetical protein
MRRRTSVFLPNLEILTAHCTTAANADEAAVTASSAASATEVAALSAELIVAATSAAMRRSVKETAVQ